MPIYLTENEREAIHTARNTEPVRRFYWRLQNLAAKFAESPVMISSSAGFEWYFLTPTAVQMTSMACAVKPDKKLENWVRQAALALARASDDDWIGPWFRDHATRPAIGHLETGHLAAALAAAFDLVPQAFTESESSEIKACLSERAIPMCRRYLERVPRSNNWLNILLHGAASAAAVLDDRETMQECVTWFNKLTDMWQSDGSYGESQQYCNYSALGLMWTYESLVRRDPSLAETLDLTPYARSVRWWTHGLLYRKPLAGAGSHSRTRVANFHDCSAVFRPTADLLLHIARRAPETLATERGLAVWLFEQHYRSEAFEDLQDLSVHALHNDFGFLLLPLLPEAPEAMSPDETDLAPVASFSIGESYARKTFRDENLTVLAVQGANDPFHVSSHRHQSANSFILTHNKERLLADPGHSCYRSSIRSIDLAARFHNTCTFDGKGQSYTESPRRFEPDTRDFASPGDSVGRKLITANTGDVTAIGYDCAAAYGEPIKRFARFWLLCGEHVLFIVDRIEASTPVKPAWHWMLNNRDRRLQYKAGKENSLLVRRNDAGMKLYHLGPGKFAGPVYSFIHDWYSPEPGRHGEGFNGSGIAFTVNHPEKTESLTVVHAIGMGDFGGTASWHLKRPDENTAILEGCPQKDSFSWSLKIDDENAPSMTIEHQPGGQRYELVPEQSGKWTFQTLK